MRKEMNQVEYSCKGFLSNFQENIIEVVAEKSEEVDTIDLNEFIERMAKFYEDHKEDRVEIKLIAKSTI